MIITKVTIFKLHIIIQRKEKHFESNVNKTSIQNFASFWNSIKFRWRNVTNIGGRKYKISFPRTREVFFVNCILATLFVHREMHELRRSDLECSLKIYVELNETSLLNVKFCVHSVQKLHLSVRSVRNSDCFGWLTKLRLVRRKLKHGAARTRAWPSYRSSNARRDIY